MDRALIMVTMVVVALQFCIIIIIIKTTTLEVVTCSIMSSTGEGASLKFEV